MSNYKKGGYDKKYIISKTSGKPTDPNADYFVLRLDKDPHALKALMTYIDSVSDKNQELAIDLLRHIEVKGYVIDAYSFCKPYELPTEELKKILWSLVKEYDVASLTCQDGEGDDVLIEEKAEAITNLLKDGK